MPTLVDIDLSVEACRQRLLNSMLDITTHSDHWDQSTWGQTLVVEAFVIGPTFDEIAEGWPCDTFACLFGNAVVKAGLAIPGRQFARHDDTPAWWLEINQNGIEMLKYYSANDVGWDAGGDFVTLGALLFGLTHDQARRLSRSTNTLRELWKLAEEFTHGLILLPAALAGEVTRIDARRAAIPRSLDMDYDLLDVLAEDTDITAGVDY